MAKNPYFGIIGSILLICLGCGALPRNMQVVQAESDLMALYFLLSEFTHNAERSNETIQIEDALSTQIELHGVDLENFTPDRIRDARQRTFFYSGMDWEDVLRTGQDDIIFGVYSSDISSHEQGKRVCFLIPPNGVIEEALFSQAQLDDIVQSLKIGRKIPFKKDP